MLIYRIERQLVASSACCKWMYDNSGLFVLWQTASGWKSKNIAAALKPVLHRHNMPCQATFATGGLEAFLWFAISSCFECRQTYGARPRPGTPTHCFTWNPNAMQLLSQDPHPPLGPPTVAWELLPTFIGPDVNRLFRVGKHATCHDGFDTVPMPYVVIDFTFLCAFLSKTLMWNNGFPIDIYV